MSWNFQLLWGHVPNAVYVRTCTVTHRVNEKRCVAATHTGKRILNDYF